MKELEFQKEVLKRFDWIEKKLEFQEELITTKTEEIMGQVNLNMEYMEDAFKKISDTLDHEVRIRVLEEKMSTVVW